MSRSSRTVGVVLWAAILSLLLKASLPMLASLAAEAQGRPVAEVCPVFGVGLPVAKAAPASHEMHGTGHEHHAHHHAGHAPPHDAGTDGDASGSHGPGHQGHCALVTLAAGGVPDAPRAGIVAAPPAAASSFAFSASAAVPDDCADWIAGRKQGPPDIA